MKKLMIALAAVAAAAGLQAAQVTWGGAFANVDCTDTLPSGTQAWLVYSADAFSGTATSIDNFAKGGVLNNGGAIVDGYTLTGVDSDAWSFQTYYTDTEAGGYANLNGYYGLLVQNPSDAKLASWAYLGEVSGVDGKTGTVDIRYNADWGTDPGPYLTEGGWTVSSSAVPEPTSGLLMLLGMAGLALRRRRA